MKTIILKNIVKFRKKKKIEKIIFESNHSLNSNSIKKLISKLNKIEKNIDKLQEEALIIGNYIDYNSLKINGKSIQELKKFQKKDLIMQKEAKKLLKRQVDLDRKYMFGYPANMIEESSMVKYLRWIESKLFYINSCGTAYEKGNYKLCKNKFELNIISSISKNLGISTRDYWGYITSGGTEGNFWGIREGLNTYPKGILYFSDSTHYSVYKYVEMTNNIKYDVIPTIDGSIDKEILVNKIINNDKSKIDGVVLVLNFVTTEMGSCDDIEYIINNLIKNGIPFYIHVDAALYGGIPNNQKKSPSQKLKKIIKLEVDSISISLHKYIGLPKTNGILLAKNKNKSHFIEYIGQHDRTICGSRDFLPFTTQQQIIEMYSRSSPNDYYKNIRYFEKKLIDNNIYFKKGDINGNIFVVKKPSKYICKKYQLSNFKKENKWYSHIIIFPFHEKIIIDNLVEDLSKEYNGMKGGK